MPKLYENRNRKTKSMPPRLTDEIINAAIDGYQEQKVRINAQIAELRAMLSGNGSETAVRPEAPPRKRRKMSSAARRRIAEAQRQRWAKVRAVSAAPAAREAAKPKRRISQEGMKRIIAATKGRWALKRAEAAKVTKRRPAVKKAATQATARAANG
jgi:hypothetical protein